MHLSPVCWPGPCGLGICIVIPVSAGINDDVACVVVFSPVSVTFAFRESTLGLLSTLDPPTMVHSGCQGGF